MKKIRKKLHMTPIQTRNFTEKVSSLVPSSLLKGDIHVIDGIACEWFKQEKPADGILIHIHGGAFAFGSLDTHRGLLNYLFKNSTFDVISPTYSLTPDAQFPIALKEVTAFYKHFKEMFPDKKIFISGDSAGGNLAVTSTLLSHENGFPLADGIILLSPWLDLREESIARKTNNDQDSGFDADDLDEYADLYADQSIRNQPLISPIVANKLDYFPPTLIQVATNELLYTDSKLFADKLQDNKIDCSLIEEDNLFHSWQLFPNYFTPAKKSLDQIIQFIEDHQ